MSDEPTLFDPEIPVLVTDETIIVPKGETQYRILLDDDEVELLAKGICPERVAQRAYDMLWWKREHYRVEAREKTTA